MPRQSELKRGRAEFEGADVRDGCAGTATAGVDMPAPLEEPDKLCLLHGGTKVDNSANCQICRFMKRSSGSKPSDAQLAWAAWTAQVCQCTPKFAAFRGARKFTSWTGEWVKEMAANKASFGRRDQCRRKCCVPSHKELASK